MAGRTLRSKDWEERLLEKPIGKARGEIVTKLGERLKEKGLKPKEFGVPSIGAIKADVMEAKARAKALQYKVDEERARKDLENLRSGGPPGNVIYAVYEDGVIRVKMTSVNPGETKTLAEVPLGSGGEGEEKKKEKPSAEGMASLVTATSEAFKAGAEVVKTGIEAGKGAEKGIGTNEVRKIVEDKLETYTAKMDAKFTELSSKIDKIIEGGGSKTTELTVIRELDSLGLLKKATEKVEGDKKEGKGEGGISELSKTIKELEDAGLVVRATKVDERAQDLAFKQEKAGMSFWLAARKLVSEERMKIQELHLKEKRADMLKGFAKDLGGAFAEAMEEAEEEEEGEEEVTGAKEKEPVIRESKKTAGGIETFTCSAEIEPGKVCGTVISIPPEAQKEGNQLVCPKCQSVYEYVPPRR